LRNGSVRVSLPGITKQTFTLSPDQKFTYSADTRKVIVSRVDAQRYTLWHERMSLSFENQPLSVILPRLERWYNCHIDCPEEIATRYHYTFSLSDSTAPCSFSNPRPTRHRSSTDATVCTCASTKNKKEPETTRLMKKNRRYG